MMVVSTTELPALIIRTATAWRVLARDCDDQAERLPDDNCEFKLGAIGGRSVTLEQCADELMGLIE